MTPCLNSLLLRWQDGAAELRDLLAPVSPVLRRVDTYAVRPAGMTGLFLVLSYRLGLSWESCVIVTDLVAGLAVLTVGAIVVAGLWRAAWDARTLPGRHRVPTRSRRLRRRVTRFVAESVAAVWLWWNSTVPFGGVA